MTESENKLNSTDERKAKIRERYKGINPDELDVIPALPLKTLDDEDREQRVAVYARVSTDDPNQTSSYELQKNHYQDVVSRHPGWNLIDIYADEGISGTSLLHRDSFVRMINDCMSGKIDLIITKSVSRFARNVVDCIGYIRQLKALNPPIGVFFETENIFTLNSNSEMSLSFISTLAQEESHTKSEIMNSSIEMRFRRGIFLTPPLLGYDQDEDGNLIINESEARTVRLIFFMYLYGYSTKEIADRLTALECKTKKGNTVWSANSVLGVLQNERHCGDVLARKTFTPSYLDHKSKKNKFERNQYRKRDHHEPIISRDDWLAVQKLIANSKYGNKGLLPELKVIQSGLLKGFVVINPRWSGFKADNYLAASSSVLDNSSLDNSTFSADSGEFDLRGFEIAHGQFFETNRKLSITFSPSDIYASIEAVRKFKTHYVEFLINPILRVFAVRASDKNSRNAIYWSKPVNGITKNRIVSGAAFLPNIYELLGWDSNYKYRLSGLVEQNDNDTILLFSIDEPEILIPQTSKKDDGECVSSIPELEESQRVIGTRKYLYGYPKEWASRFGNNYYKNASYSLSKQIAPNAWDTQSQGESVETDISSLNVTDIKQLESNIQAITSSIKGESL